MSKTPLTVKVRLMLSARAAGRCQFRGCNALLDEDELTRRQDRFGAFAHIVADSADGPRGDAVRSAQLADKIENLMLLCHTHHKLIDGGHWREFTEADLRRMKAEHESRVRDLTAHQGQLQTHLLTTAAAIGDRAGDVVSAEARAAVLPRYAQGLTCIPLKASRQGDGEELFWRVALVDIQRGVAEVQALVDRGEVAHVSILGLAPIPLLVWLGYRMGDLVPGEALQKRRQVHDPADLAGGWGWKEDGPDLRFRLEPENVPLAGDAAVLALSVSGEVAVPAELRGFPVLHLRVERPGLDIIQSRSQVEIFKRLAREAMALLQGATEIHVVPALPNSLAVEFGRLQLPKAHPPLLLHERFDGRWGTRPVLRLHGAEAQVVAS